MSSAEGLYSIYLVNKSVVLPAAAWPETRHRRRHRSVRQIDASPMRQYSRQRLPFLHYPEHTPADGPSQVIL